MNIFNSFYGIDYKITVTASKFSYKGHKLHPAIESKGVMARIDNQIFWGNKWETFEQAGRDGPTVLTGLTFQRRREVFDFPRSALFGAFDISFQTFGGEKPSTWVDFKTGVISLKLDGGDGGDTYFAFFSVSRDGTRGTRKIFLADDSKPIETKSYKLLKRKVQI